MFVHNQSLRLIIDVQIRNLLLLHDQSSHVHLGRYACNESHYLTTLIHVVIHILVLGCCLH